MSLKLIDISHFQNVIDPGKLAIQDILSGVLCKATQGNDFTDSTFAFRMRRLDEIGLVKGAYHFYDPTIDPVAQAQYFTSVISAYCPLIPALDLEEGKVLGWTELSNDENCSRVQDFLDEFARHFKGLPHIYTSASFMESYLKGLNLSAYPLWVADYSQNPPRLPSPWISYSIWQKIAGDTEVGIIGSVDLDEFNGTVDDLKALCVTAI